MLPTLRRGRLMDPFEMLRQDMLSRWVDGGEVETIGSYPVDIREDDNHVFVDAEVPGFKKEQIEVTLENGVLSITAKREQTQEQGQQHLQERRFARVARAFTLPVAVDENKVEAHLQDGVLHLKLHKREEVKPRRIEVK